jgi:hypothetical protein
MVESFETDELTDYLFYNTQRTSNVLLKAGDQVKFNFLAAVDAATALKLCTISSQYKKNESYCALTSLQTASNMI